MKKKNIKGLTLLELLIAMAIFTIVIFIGYKIINQSTKSVKDQGNINKGQLTMNDMNEYLTKDLEQATSIKLLLDGVEIADTRPKEGEVDIDKSNELQIKVSSLVESKLNDGSMTNFKYEYIVRDTGTSESDNDYTKYVTEVKKENTNMKYSVSRITKDGIKIDFIESQILMGNKLPFSIIGNSPYKVTIKYNGKANKMVSHDFNITSRYLLSGGDNGGSGEGDNDTLEPPDIDIPDGYDAIGYWTASIEKQPTENLYSWVNDELSDPGNQDNIKNNNYLSKFNIQGKNGDNGNSGHTWANIGYPNDIITSNNKDTSMKPKDIRSIYIYVSKGTTLSNVKDNISLSDKDKTIIGIEELPFEESGYTLKGGATGNLYKCILDKKFKNDKRIFDITGLLSIDKNSVDTGFAMIIYGNGENIEDDELEGNLIFEYTNKGETQNKGQFDWNKTIYCNISDDEIESESDEKKHGDFREYFNIFLNIDSGKITAHSGGQSTISASNEMLKEVTGIRVLLEGDIMVENFSFPNYKQQNLVSGISYEFSGLSKNQYNIGGNLIITNNNNIGQKARIIVDFIYN